MKFYELKYTDDIDFKKLFTALESIGDFVLNKKTILFYCDKLSKAKFKGLKVEIKPIDPLNYIVGDSLLNEWLIANFRKFRVEDMLKQAELEKQEEISNLYTLIKKATEIIEKGGDIDGGVESDV